MTVDHLAKAIGCHIDRAAKWHPFLVTAMARFGIDTINEKASFIAQISHESAMLSRLEENLNYSAQGLAATWPSRYRDRATGKANLLALSLHRRPIAIANNCYANPSVTIVIDPNAPTEAELVKPFWHAQTAADYLTWLRK